MKKMELNWSVGYMDTPEGIPQEWMPATVPGAVQLDYARAKGWGPFYEGVRFQDYQWMENVCWLYRAPLVFTAEPGQRAWLCFDGIDYRYRIRVDGEGLWEGEGMFSPIRLDVTRFAGREIMVEVVILPVPKAEAVDSLGRSQGRKSCKSVACYGWDWHPRLISAGLWDEVSLCITDAFAIRDWTMEYTLSESLDSCQVLVQMETIEDSAVHMEIRDDDGRLTAAWDGTSQNGQAVIEGTINQPKLWYPIGYGSQTRYTVTVTTLHEDGTTADIGSRRVGFRRSRLVMNEGSWSEPAEFPKTRSDAPITLEVNGQRLFAKGSNWVNAQVFPGTMNGENYDQLLELVKDANMNLLRVWGGGFINKESFFELCDEKGIMVWQEFPLACNEYPDEDAYLAVLEQEARAIIRRLRSHPCVVIWCGGNELFNNWSGMTDQHHALRLLNAVCYAEDRFTPFLMTSPLNGMAHGHYVNYDEHTGLESITRLQQCHNTAYTEFGCPGMPELDYLKGFMDQEDLADCRPENDVWREHHGFGAWGEEAWIRRPEMDYFFGGYEGVEDLCEKSAFVQKMCYRSMFEEMRHQWPHCSMAINWCYNEPWPTAANNSLISWPVQPRPAYYAVKEALRPQAASLRISRHLWRGEETFTAQVWMLNDTLDALKAGRVTVSYALDGEEAIWGTLRFPEVQPQSNCECGGVAFSIPQGYMGKLHLYLRVEGRPDLDAEYTYLCRP